MQRSEKTILIEDSHTISLNNLSILELKNIIDSKALANALQNPLVTTVECMGSGLNRLDENTLAAFSSAFENSTVKIIDLSRNNLGLCKPTQLQSLFMGFKNTALEELHLENNNLAKLGGDEFRGLLQCVHAAFINSLILLDLDDNNLWWLGKHGLETLINFIQSSKVQALSIDGNRFHYFQPEMYSDTKFSGLAIQLAHYMEMQYFQEKGAYLGSMFQDRASSSATTRGDQFNYAKKHLLSEDEFRLILNNQLSSDCIKYFCENGVLKQNDYVLIVDPLIHNIEKILADNNEKYTAISANCAKS